MLRDRSASFRVLVCHVPFNSKALVSFFKEERTTKKDTTGEAEHERESKTDIVDVGVNRFGIEPFFPANALMFFDVLAHPDVSVHAKDDIDGARGDGEEMGFETADELGRDGYELSVSKL